MTSLPALWLPILLSAVLVFLLSSVIHMLSPWHKGDFPRLRNQDAVMDALRPLDIPPGDYLMPRPTSREEMRSPQFAETMKRGPVVMMTVMPSGPMSMGRNLGQWFIYCLVLSLLAAYVPSRVLQPAARFADIFRLAATTALLGYTGRAALRSDHWRRHRLALA
jgi:hypothetical protein